MSVDTKSLPDNFKDAELFVDHLCGVYGVEKTQQIVRQLGTASDLSFWINPLVTGTPSDLTSPALLGISGQAVDNLPGVWSVSRNSGITASTAANDASIYIQNPSSVLAVRALAPQLNDEVLDLAAAPGGKTIAMAAAMQNSGRIAAVEPVKGRFFRLKANVERCGVSNVELYLRDGRGVGRAVPERFDRVLLDAPCSSEARMRWFDASTYRHWSLRKVKEAQRKQKRLIRSAYAALKPGGRMVYCTCSFSVAENEQVVEHLLLNSDAALVPVTVPLPRHVPGVTSWRNKSMHAELSRSVRVMPDSVWDGFYLAVLEKPANP